VVRAGCTKAQVPSCVYFLALPLRCVYRLHAALCVVGMA
jgi:hypothetical protein